MFEVTIITCAGVRIGVEAGEHDFGLMLQPDEDAGSTVAERTVVSDNVELVVFAQLSHPLGGRGSAPVGRDTLDGFTLYITDAAGEYHTAVRRFLTHDGLPGPHLQPTGSVESVKRAVLGDSRALGMLPAYALLEEMRAGRVAPILVRPAPPRMQLEALTSSTRSQHPAV